MVEVHAGAVVDHQREGNPRVLVLLAALAGQDLTVVLHGREAWDPSWSERVPLLADAPAPGRAARLAFWRAGLNGDSLSDTQLDELASQLVLAPTEVSRAITARIGFDKLIVNVQNFVHSLAPSMSAAS